MVIDFVSLLPIFMFLALAILLFSGFPVAFVLGGVGLGFGFIGLYFEVFSFTIKIAVITVCCVS